jgi:hypothetical protein
MSPTYNARTGVPLTAIIYGGRRSRLIPLVVESFDWEHGVFLASICSSETTVCIHSYCYRCTAGESVFVICNCSYTCTLTHICLFATAVQCLLICLLRL